MSEQQKEAESRVCNNFFLSPDALPVIDDPYAVLIEDIKPVDGRLFQMGIHEAPFKHLRVALSRVQGQTLNRFHQVEVVGKPERLRSGFVRGITDLPVRVHPL